MCGCLEMDSGIVRVPLGADPTRQQLPSKEKEREEEMSSSKNKSRCSEILKRRAKEWNGAPSSGCLPSPRLQARCSMPEVAPVWRLTRFESAQVPAMKLGLLERSPNLGYLVKEAPRSIFVHGNDYTHLRHAIHSSTMPILFFRH